MRQGSTLPAPTRGRIVLGFLPIIAAMSVEVFMPQASASARPANVVLVHGGFVDGSGWQGVYKALKKHGYSVTIVQNPTFSLADDVAVTRRALAAQSGMRKEHETARTRVLSDEEIRTLINGFDQTRYGRALRLLFLTALRRDEVLGLKWSRIDLERGVLTIPPSAEKTGRVRDELRRAGLPPQAVALLAADSLKPILYRLRGRRSNGWPPSKDKRAKQRNAVLPDDVNIHDIRRTVADALLNRIGAPPWIVDHVVLGHARPKLLRTYMPTLPLGEARDVLQKWGEEIDRILGADVGTRELELARGADHRETPAASPGVA